jgi:predicted enzyme related to lactoylglutathione lyase
MTGKAKLARRELVILAKDYDAMVAWYVNVLGFRVTRTFDDGYRYSNLKTESGIRIGIAPAAEMGVALGDPANNAVLLQVGVPDVRVFFEHLREAGGDTTFGPSFDEAGQFWYGGFTDLEGNPIWVVDANCP